MNFQLDDLKKLQPGYLILLFYSVIMTVTATIGWYMDNRDGFTIGYIVGIVISLLLWFLVGRTMANV